MLPRRRVYRGPEVPDMVMSQRHGDEDGAEEEREPGSLFRMGTITTMGDPELERRAQRLREEQEEEDDA